MDITFDILKKACRFTGVYFHDSKNCNHKQFTYEGDLDIEGYDEGYIIRSDQPCCEEVCPMLVNPE